jgi:hypothetical protein
MAQAEKSFIRKAIESLALKFILFIAAFVGTAVLTWYTANSAWVHGLPGYKVGLIVAGVFALCSIGTYFLILSIARVPLRNAPAGSLLEPQGSWLDDVAENDRLKLREAVFVTHCRLDMTLTGSDPHLLFHFSIRNCAVYAISLDPALEGFISFDGRPLKGEKTMSSRFPQNLTHCWGDSFEIRQELSPSEGGVILNDANATATYFDFKNFRIVLKADNSHRVVAPTTLQLRRVFRDGRFDWV